MLLLSHKNVSRERIWKSNLHTHCISEISITVKKSLTRFWFLSSVHQIPLRRKTPSKFPAMVHHLSLKKLSKHCFTPARVWPSLENLRNAPFFKEDLILLRRKR